MRLLILVYVIISSNEYFQTMPHHHLSTFLKYSSCHSTGKQGHSVDFKALDRTDAFSSVSSWATGNPKGSPRPIIQPRPSPKNTVPRAQANHSIQAMLFGLMVHVPNEPLILTVTPLILTITPSSRSRGGRNCCCFAGSRSDRRWGL